MKLEEGLRLLTVLISLLHFQSVIQSAAGTKDTFTHEEQTDNSNEELLTMKTLCELSENCLQLETRKTALETVEALLRAGENPNSKCPNSNQSVLSLLVSSACHRMLKKIISIDDVPNPINLNAEFKLCGQTFTALSFVISKLPMVDSNCGNFKDCAWCSTFSALLRNRNLDVNAKTPSGVFPVEFLYLNSLTLSGIMRLRFLHLFWVRPELNDYQREFILKHWSSLNVNKAESKLWTILLPERPEFGSKKFADQYLQMFFRAEPKSLSLPLCITIPRFYGEEAGTATFLEHLSAAAFSFGAYEDLFPQLAGDVRISVTKKDRENGNVEQVFSPSPSSVHYSKKTNSFDWDFFVLTNKFERRMLLIGRIIGICLNTLFVTPTISLGVPLDRVVLQRLLDPKSPISRSEALDSAICTSALQTFRQGFSLRKAIKELSFRFPPIRFKRVGPNKRVRGGEDEWKDYCVELVGHTLNPDTSVAFQIMLKGFRDTIPKHQTQHNFSPQLAHRFLVGHRRITMDLLTPHLKFPKRSDPTLFLSVLGELAEKDPNNLNRFVKQVTGSSYLSETSFDTPIRIKWLPDNLGSRDQILKSITCSCSLAMVAIKDRELMRIALQNLMSNETSDEFDHV